MKEAALLKPQMADKENYLAVNWGINRKGQV